MARNADLVIKMVADADGVKRGVRTATRETSRFSRQASTTARATQNLRSAFVGAAAAAGGAAMAYLSVAQAQQAITTTQELGLATIGLSRNLGLATKEASRWAAVSRARGIDSKALTMGFTTLSRKLEEAKDGTESSMEAFKALGITQSDLRKTNGSFTKQVTMMADAFGEAEGSTVRQAAAQKLLGRGYQTILPMFSKGAEGLKEQLKWADEFGATMGQDTVDAIDAYTTAQRKTKVAMMGLQVAFSSMLLPALTDAQGEFQSFVKVLNSDISTEQKVKVIQQQLTRLADGLLSVVEDLMPQIAQRAGEVGVRMAGALAKGFMETGFLGKLAIGALVVRWLGGTAAIAAAGTRVGGIMAGGINTAMLASAPGYGASTYQTARSFGRGQVTSNIAAMGGAATTAAAAFKGLGIQMGAVALAVAQFQQFQGMFKLWIEKPAEGAMDRLDQFVAKAETWQGRLASLVSKTPSWLDGLLGSSAVPGMPLVRKGVDALFGDLGDEAAAAKSLKNALAEIRTADADRFVTLRGIIRRRADELSLTRDQRREINGMVADSKQGRTLGLNRSTSRFAEQARSGMFVGRDLQRATEQQLAKISAAYNRFTPQWRNSVWKVLKAQEDAVRRTWTKNGKLTREGIERIKEIQLRRRNLLAGADPYGIAKGLVNSWKRAGSVNERGLARMTARLKEMPPKARAAAAKTMLDYARELENKGKLPEGTVKKLSSRLRVQFGDKLWKDMSQSTRTGWNALGDLFKSGADKAEKPMKELADAARRHSKVVRTAITSIPRPAATAYGKLASYTNQAKDAFGSSKPDVTLSFRRGGKAFGRGGTVPAMVSPGERIDYRGKSWVVPGRPEPRDSVFATLPVGAAVLTADGQARMAMGESRSSAIRNQLPHFRGGGEVGQMPRPKLSGGAAVSTSIGNAAIQMVRDAAVKFLAKAMASGKGGTKRSYPGLTGDTDFIPALGMALSKMARASGNPIYVTSGFRSYAEQAALYQAYLNGTGNLAAPPGSSNHESGRAADISPGRETFGSMAGGYGLGFTVPSESWHIELLRRGGVIKGYGKGGRVPGKNDVWNNDQLASLAHAVGMKNPGYMAQIANGESSGRPWAVGHDPGGTTGLGLWQITTGYNDDLIAKYGGTDAMLDPIKNAKAAKEILDRQGTGAWYAPPRGERGDVIPWLAQALRSGKTGGTVTEKPQKPANIRVPSGGVTPSGKGGVSVYTPEAFKKQRKRAANKVARQAGRQIGQATQIAKDARNGKLAQKAINAAKRARELARDGKINAARKWLNKSERWANMARQSIPGLKPTKPGFSTKGLPASTVALLQSPGLSWQNKRDILDMAVTEAGQTDTLVDDKAAYKAIIAMGKGKAKNARQRYAKAGRMLARKGLTRKQRNYWQRVQADALSDLGEARGDITSARESIKGLTESDSGASDSGLAEAMKELADAIKQQTAVQSSVEGVSAREGYRMLADMLGGELVGRRAIPSTPVGVRY